MKIRAKKCKRCNLEQSLDQFSKDKRRVDGLQNWCKTCHKESYKPKYRDQKLQKRYGISMREYDLMLLEQNNSCYICLAKEPGRKNMTHFAVDHSHKSGKVRSLLCDRCNKALGFLKEDTSLLHKFEDYLNLHSRSEKLFAFMGASGVGKSTLLSYIEENFTLNVEELSARPFLPKDGRDYVNSLDSTSQVLITMNRFVSLSESIINCKPTVFSRSTIDSLAYEMVLKKAPYLVQLLQRQVEITKNSFTYLYIPIEFDMKNGSDMIRGSNRKIQLETDKAIKEVLEYHKIDYLTVSGNKEERFKKLDMIFEEYRL